MLLFSACIDKIAINSTKRRAEKNENKSAEVEQMSEKSIVVLFYYFSCVIHLDVKKAAEKMHCKEYKIGLMLLCEMSWPQLPKCSN